MSKGLAKFVTPASDGLVCHDHTALEEQLLDVAQAQLKAEIPSNSAADDASREAVTVIERFRFLHQFILPPPPHQPDSAVQGSPNSIRCVARIQ
jgi:hypothetical protein